jgi:hypothetical protein
VRIVDVFTVDDFRRSAARWAEWSVLHFQLDLDKTVAHDLPSRRVFV